jgi:hypothetical protein
MARRSADGGGCGRQNRVVLAPVAGVKPAEARLAQPGAARRRFAGDGDKMNSSPGRARHKPLKPLRRERRLIRSTCGDYRVHFFAHGPRVQRAPGVPCALRFLGGDMTGIPRGETARGNAGVCLEQCGGVFGATSLPRSPLSCPASCGASSTPRLLGSSTGVFGILDRPIKSGDDG